MIYLTTYCKAYIDNYCDDSFIENIKQSCKTQDVLQYLYNLLIEDEIRNVLNPYFFLLVKSNEDIVMKNKLSIQNIIEMQSSRIFEIFDLAATNTEIKSF